MFGFQIRIDDSLGVEWSKVQCRFPRSKKKRIRKKWAKQSKNFEWNRRQVPLIYRMGNIIIANSPGYIELKAAVEHAQKTKAIRPV